MSNESLTRRNLLKQGVLASAALPFMNLTTNAAFDYDKYDGLGLAELIRKKQITPLELLHAVQQRLEAVNPKLNVFAYLFFDKAEAAIKQGLPAGPFQGVPFALGAAMTMALLQSNLGSTSPISLVGGSSMP